MVEWVNRTRADMNAMAILCASVVFSGSLFAQGIPVQKIQGDVQVRHGVTEEWSTIAAGDVLKPDDSIRTGKNGQAVIVAIKDGGQKHIALPSEVIVDIADIRDLTAEELMLKLTMERVRSSPYKSRDDLTAPNAGVVHGANEASGSTLPLNDPSAGAMQWKGAKVLYNNGFYSTCALKGMELYRLYPESAKDYNCRLVVAQSLERANLHGEALSEFGAILSLDGLTQAQQASVKHEMNTLETQ